MRHPSQPPRLGDHACRVVGSVDVTVIGRVPVEALQRRDEMLGRAAAAAGVAPDHDVGPDLFDQSLDLRWVGLVEALMSPVVVDPLPARAVHPAGALADRGRDDRDVFGERHCVRGGPNACCGGGDRDSPGDIPQSCVVGIGLAHLLPRARTVGVSADVSAVVPERSCRRRPFTVAACGW
jgi:hypothetical protein